MSWVRGSHHVLGIKHLLRQLGNGDSTVLLAATRRQRSESSHEEVETREWNLTTMLVGDKSHSSAQHTHVNSKLAEIRV